MWYNDFMISKNSITFFLKKGISLTCLCFATQTGVFAQTNQNSHNIVPKEAQNTYYTATTSFLNTTQNSFHQTADFIKENGQKYANFIQESGEKNFLKPITNPISKIVEGSGDIAFIITQGAGNVIKRTEPAFSFPIHLVEHFSKKEAYQNSTTIFNLIQNDLLSSFMFCLAETMKTTVHSGFRAAHIICDVTDDILGNISNTGQKISPEITNSAEQKIKETQKALFPNENFLPTKEELENKYNGKHKKKLQEKIKKMELSRKKRIPDSFPKPKKLYAHNAIHLKFFNNHTRG